MVNINSRLDKVPILSSVNLPGGVEEEVHGGRADDEVFGGGRSHQCGGSEYLNDRSLTLHTRSLN